MVRRSLLALTAVFAVVALVRGATEVTFVMKNGERLSGTFVYNHTDHYNLIVNGQERSYPSDDIAMIAFVAGDPTAAEIAKLPAVNDPPELERHSVVLRSGEMIRGKIWDFQDTRVIMDMGPGDRRTYNMSDVARLYISAPGSRAVFKSATTDQVAGMGRRGGRMPPVVVNVAANKAWIDSGVSVNQGDSVWFSVTDQINVTSKTVIGPEGFPSPGGQRAPLPMSPLGALVGKVGASVFLIGKTTDPIVMPATGRVMLGVNDQNLGDNKGQFQVTIRR